MMDDEKKIMKEVHMLPYYIMNYICRLCIHMGSAMKLLEGPCYLFSA